MTNKAMTESVNFIDKIIIASDNISEISLQISTSVNEQSDVSLSLDKNVNHIVSSGQKSNILINQINDKAETLDGFVQQLMALAKQFKV
jgi:methyl-accepting chemotaxis protein